MSFSYDETDDLDEESQAESLEDVEETDADAPEETALSRALRQAAAAQVKRDEAEEESPETEEAEAETADVVDADVEPQELDAVADADLQVPHVEAEAAARTPDVVDAEIEPQKLDAVAAVDTQASDTIDTVEIVEDEAAAGVPVPNTVEIVADEVEAAAETADADVEPQETGDEAAVEVPQFNEVATDARINAAMAVFDEEDLDNLIPPVAVVPSADVEPFRPQEQLNYAYAEAVSAYYEAQDYQRAIDKFGEAIEAEGVRTDGSAADSREIIAKALYWQAEAFVKLEDIPRAREMFDNVIRGHQQHYLSLAAQRRMEQLNLRRS